VLLVGRELAKVRDDILEEGLAGLGAVGEERYVLSLVNYFAVEDGDVDFGLLDGFGCDGENVVGEDDQVCELPRFDRSLDRFLMFGERRSHGVGMDGLCNADALLGRPAVWIFAVERAAQSGGGDSR
jgi:hypothetical protein